MFQTSMREQGFRHRGSNQLGGFVSHWTVAARTTGEAPLGGRVGFPKLRLDPDHVEEVVELSDVANVMGCLLEKFSTQTQHVAFPGAQDPCNTCPVPPTGLSQVFRLSGLGFISIRCLKFNFGSAQICPPDRQRLVQFYGTSRALFSSVSQYFPFPSAYTRSLHAQNSNQRGSQQ